jgi:hypothetical protein
VKIFWLDLTVTMALALSVSRRFCDPHCIGCCVYRIRCTDIRAIVVPFCWLQTNDLVLLRGNPAKTGIMSEKRANSALTKVIHPGPMAR